MQLAEVLKLKLNTTEEASQAFADTCYQYMLACDAISVYVFNHDFYINSVGLSKELYSSLREGLALNLRWHNQQSALLLPDTRQ